MVGVAEVLGIEAQLRSEAWAAKVIMEEVWRRSVAMHLIFAVTTVLVMSAVSLAERLGVVHPAGLVEPPGMAGMVTVPGMAGMVAALGTGVVVACFMSQADILEAGIS